MRTFQFHLLEVMVFKICRAFVYFLIYEVCEETKRDRAFFNFLSLQGSSTGSEKHLS